MGPKNEIFKVPYALLVKHSVAFKNFCLIHADNRTIDLPCENASVFEKFFLWIHSSKPEVDFSKGMDGIFDLAIFAEKYTICPLINSITDYIKTATMRGELTLDPTDLDSIYSSTPDSEKSVLCQICSWNILWQILNPEDDNDSQVVSKKYAKIFALHSDLGRDFFLLTSEEDAIDLEPCKFHDHSDIIIAGKEEEGKGKGKITACPYFDC